MRGLEAPGVEVSNPLSSSHPAVPLVSQVMWQLGSNRRTFLPRLGGAVMAIAPSAADPALYTVTQADNTVRLVRNKS